MISGRGSCARAFWRGRDGNVAMMWALMGSVLVGLLGITVDFTRAQMLRAQMQNAVDGAALAAARGDMHDRSSSARKRRAPIFDAEMGDLASNRDAARSRTSPARTKSPSAQPCRCGSASRASCATKTGCCSSTSDAERSGNNIEVALVLDVTGLDGRPAHHRSARRGDRSRRHRHPRSAVAVLFEDRARAVLDGRQRRQLRRRSARRHRRAGRCRRRGLAYGPAHNISGITRANPAVVTATSHGFANGDYGLHPQRERHDAGEQPRVHRSPTSTTNTFQLRQRR